MYLPNKATIEEACEWLLLQTGQQWTLPRLLEEGHLCPYVWIDYVEGMPQLFGDRREGYLTKMIFNGDIIRLAADRNDALLTMFTTHDGVLVRPVPGWRVDLKDIRFLKQDVLGIVEHLSPEIPAAPVATRGTPKALTDAQEADVVRLYDRGRGVSVNRLAKQFGVSNPTIDKVLKRAGIKK